jgi:hypothetical protein
MEKLFSGSECVAGRDAKRHSGFVRTATAARAIAARLAAPKLGAGSAVLPTAGTSGARKAGSIIVTDNVRTANVTRPFA